VGVCMYILVCGCVCGGVGVWGGGVCVWLWVCGCVMCVCVCV